VEFVLAGHIASLFKWDYRDVRRFVGKPDCVVRRGCSDLPAWIIGRVDAIRAGLSFPFPAPEEPPEYLTLIESARLAGVTRQVAGRRMKPDATLLYGTDDHPLFLESTVMALRMQIRNGSANVQPRSLTKPVAGVIIDNPRHVWATDQRTESERIDRHRPFAGMLY
jgi:hypothetical protein